MKTRKANLSSGERSVSALFGVALSSLALASNRPVFRALCAVLASGLFMRAATGRGRTNAASHRTSARERRAESQALDESLQQTFPASDPPASRLPDEPPANADAKWAAARAAGQVS
jgi:uncharacterized membrane protein